MKGIKMASSGDRKHSRQDMERIAEQETNPSFVTLVTLNRPEFVH